MKQILNWIFPRCCAICDEIVGGDGLICTKCRTVPIYIKEPKCKKCGKKVEDNTKEFCYDCSNRLHFYEEGLALFEYDSIYQSIYRFKYKGRCEYGEYFGKEMATYLGEAIHSWKPDGLLPVPLHKSKERTRGYNQAKLLAEVIGRELKIPVYEHIIERCRKTTPQKQIDRRDRQNNLKKAFKICSNDVKLSTVIIIDDIYTTGSTIDAMAVELKKYNIKKVFFIALSIGNGI